MSPFRAFLTVSRANIQTASFPTAALGLTLAVHDVREWLRLPSLLYLLFFFTLLTFACQWNCLHDLEVDSKYKKYMSDAVRAIGIPRLKIILGIEFGFACLILGSLAAMKGSAFLLLGILGAGAAIVYSAPPFRIKKRGMASFLPVMIGLYFLPVVGGALLAAARPSAFIVVFAFGYALLMEGITLINTCEDYHEDEAAGIRTVAHVLGVRRTLKIGAVAVLSGGILALGLVLFGREVRTDLSAAMRLCVATLSLLFLGSIAAISRRLFLIGRSENAAELCKLFAKKMPAWFIQTRYTLFILSLIL